MSGYRQGRDVEWAVSRHLVDEGYEVIRAAQSRGLADLAAFKPGQVLFVNVKRTTPPGPAERAALLRVAGFLPGVGVALVALGPCSRLTFRRLTGTGPAEWVPWTTDEMGDDQ